MIRFCPSHPKHKGTTTGGVTGCCLRTTVPGRCSGISPSNYCFKELISLAVKSISTTIADCKRVLQWLILSSLKKQSLLGLLVKIKWKNKGFVFQKLYCDIPINLIQISFNHNLRMLLVYPEMKYSKTSNTYPLNHILYSIFEQGANESKFK